MPESTSLPDQQKWNGFVSKFGQALDDWRQNNNGKIPTDMQKREIAQEILFPQPPEQQASPQRPQPAPAPLMPVSATSPRQGRCARQTPIPLETGAIKNQLSEDTNTSKNNYADTNVLDFNGKPDQIAKRRRCGRVRASPAGSKISGSDEARTGGADLGSEWSTSGFLQ